jgi:hypothetical protein
MGRISKVLSFLRTLKNGAKVSDVKIDSGGRVNITAEHFAPAGDDSYPLTTDYAVTVHIQKTGGEVTVGYVDPLSEPQAQPGDKRIYARNEAGVPTVQVWLKNDGAAVISNGNGSIELEAGGDVVINGATIDTAGNISSPTSIAAPSIVVDGKELDDHVHSGVTTGGSNTGPIV